MDSGFILVPDVEVLLILRLAVNIQLTSFFAGIVLWKQVGGFKTILTERVVEQVFVSMTM